MPERKVTDEDLATLEKTRRRQALLETFERKAQMYLVSPAGEKGRHYLHSRGFKDPDIQQIQFGLYSKTDDIRHKLTSEGFTDQEIDESGVCSDRRWEGRIVRAWRDIRGNIQTFFARDLTGDGNEKYLYLAGASHDKLLAFGLHRALRYRETRRNLVIVEGFFDADLLHVRGFHNVVALGRTGTFLTPERWRRLGELGIESVTLALDNDQEAGQKGILKAIDNAHKNT